MLHDTLIYVGESTNVPFLRYVLMRVKRLYLSQDCERHQNPRLIAQQIIKLIAMEMREKSISCECI